MSATESRKGPKPVPLVDVLEGAAEDVRSAWLFEKAGKLDDEMKRDTAKALTNVAHRLRRELKGKPDDTRQGED